VILLEGENGIKTVKFNKITTLKHLLRDALTGVLVSLNFINGVGE
jgi:hypothetical protein